MPTSSATYAVADSDQITVDVLIGDEQPGGSTVSLGTTEIGSGGDTLTGVRIGRGSDIRGSKIIVVSEVENKNSATDRTSVDVTVNGGAASKEISQQQTAANKGAVVPYVTVVTVT